MSQALPAINLVHLPRVTSTMDVLDDLIAAGAPEWTVVVADEQTAGLGRADRTWEAESGSALLCSVLVRPRFPPTQTGLLAIAVGVAMAEYLETLGVRVALKWPNDVLLDGRKLGGVLIRTRRDAIGVVANVGIGLNLVRSESHDVNRAALGQVLPDVPRPMDIVEGVIGLLSTMTLSPHTSSWREVWMSRAAFLGELVTVERGSKLITGLMRGIDQTGALQIEAEDGVIQGVTAGDLVRGPRVGAG